MDKVKNNKTVNNYSIRKIIGYFLFGIAGLFVLVLFIGGILGYLNAIKESGFIKANIPIFIGLVFAAIVTLAAYLTIEIPKEIPKGKIKTINLNKNKKEN